MTKSNIIGSAIFSDNQFHALADELLKKAQALNTQYWELHEQMSQTKYSTFMEQMQDAQRLGKFAQAINELQQVNGTLRHITGTSIK